MSEKISFDSFEAVLLRKPIRHMYLRVSQETGEVIISAPFELELGQIRYLVLKRRDWLQRRLEARAACKIYPENMEAVWGRHVTRSLSDSASGWNIECSGSSLSISGPGASACSQDIISRKLNLWRREEVLSKAHQYIDLWTGKLGLNKPDLACRRMKRRWGTCYPAKRRIMLNSQLSCFDPACLELVVVHELGHLLFPHHGKEFRNWLARQIPDWKEREKKMVL